MFAIFADTFMTRRWVTPIAALRPELHLKTFPPTGFALFVV